MPQLTLDLDVRETCQARIERIATLLQADNRIERASTYFDEANAAHAEAIAAADAGRMDSLSHPCDRSHPPACRSAPRTRQSPQIS